MEREVVDKVPGSQGVLIPVTLSEGEVDTGRVQLPRLCVHQLRVLDHDGTDGAAQGRGGELCHWGRRRGREGREGCQVTMRLPGRCSNTTHIARQSFSEKAELPQAGLELVGLEPVTPVF